mmetsp:Transcript_15097/g.45078  ORF Transcript_15097/g.45078 Transcript_15097/m.45078 type:complete len:226 (+) Transcript_15097:218-895(+)
MDIDQGAAAHEAPPAAAPEPKRPRTEAENQQFAVLDAFHAAAANGRIDAYLSHLADAFVFLGTDPRERWDRAAFEEYARGRFAAGDHWRYRVLGRNAFSPAGMEASVALFDETLDHKIMGRVRGTGALVWQARPIPMEGGDWKISQYSLSLPVPNMLMAGVAEIVRPFANDPEPTISEKRLLGLEGPGPVPEHLAHLNVPPTGRPGPQADRYVARSAPGGTDHTP